MEDVDEKSNMEQKLREKRAKNYVVPWRLMPNVFHTVVVGVVKPSICEEIEGVDVDLIRRQHESLVRIFRELNLRVYEVELQGSYNNYLLLDRTVVSCHGIAFLPKPRTVADQHNTQILSNVLKTNCSQVVVEQRNPMAKVCGSDVLFTGVEVIVGISETTNEAGANELAEAFTDFPVTAIKMPNGADHIKNYVTVAGDMILAAGPSDLAKDIVDKIKNRVSQYYSILELAEDEAANCIFVNRTLIHQAIEEIPNSFKIFIEKSRYVRRSICFSEFAKMRGGLTSACVLTKRVI